MTTYCGKNCDACTYREELSCTGCQSGPGRKGNGDCKLASCCRDKGHETCETCELKRNCGIWLDKGSIPKQRMERRQEEKERQALIERRAPLLGKWLRILFWITIASLGINFITDNTSASSIPALRMAGQVCSYLCQFFIIYVLFVISKEHHYFRNAAILTGISFAINILVVFISEDQIWLLLLIALLQVALVLLADYFEYKANADVILIVDGRISEQWDNYWNWMLCSSIGVAVSLFLVFLIPGLGAILSVISSGALVIARIKKLFCLYRSAEAFRAKAQ